jgi:hypothetical protein
VYIINIRISEIKKRNKIMTIKSIDEKISKIEIDLTGTEGNIIILLDKAKSYCRMLDFNRDKTDKILYELQKSDYENLINVFDKYFGHFVTLYK